MDLNLTDPDRILARLDSLEAQNQALLRQNRRIKYAVVAGVFAVAGLTFLALVRSGQADDPKPKKVVEADEFVIKGADGKPRTTLQAGSVLLHNEDGDVRLAMFANKAGGTGILLFAANDQKQQISIMHTKEGLLSFGINDANGKTRAMLATRADGKPVLVLQNENQKSIFSQGQK